MRIRFTGAARRELRHAARWYERKQKGLGALFKQAIDGALDRLSEYPLSGSEVEEGIRFAVVSGYPYVIWYEVFDDKILVHAVSHTSRKPGYWQN